MTAWKQCLPHTKELIAHMNSETVAAHTRPAQVQTKQNLSPGKPVRTDTHILTEQPWSPFYIGQLLLDMGPALECSWYTQ